jgi:hypothetical protein
VALTIPVAFLALSPAQNGFLKAHNYATHISNIKKMCRFAALQHWQDKLQVSVDEGIAPFRLSPEPTDGEGSGPITAQEVDVLVEERGLVADSLVEVEEHNRSVANSFRKWVHNYLTTEYPTPMN